VGPSASGAAFVFLNHLGDICSSKDWGTHGTQEWDSLHFFRDGKGQGLNELPLILCMIGRGISRRTRTDRGSGLACGFSIEGRGTPTGTGGGSGSKVFSCHLGTVCSGLEMGWWIRW
jgi:hypothetical protein